MESSIASLRLHRRGSRIFESKYGSLINKCLAVPVSPYVDDYLFTDSAVNGIDSVLALHSVLGIKVHSSPEKLFPPVDTMLSLGIRVQILGKSGVRVSPLTERTDKVADEIDGIIAQGSIRHAQCLKLAGRAHFIAGQLFGRVGRAPIRFLHFLAEQHISWISDVTERNLLFLKHIIQNSPSRVFYSNKRDGSKAIAWVAGFWNPSKMTGGIGGVLVIIKEDGSKVWKCFSSAIPPNIHARWALVEPTKKQYNFFTDLLAATVLVNTFGKDLCNFGLLAFEDSNAAAGGIRRGLSGSDLAYDLVSSFWITCAKYSIAAWLERVASPMNPSDGLSRLSLKLAVLLGWMVVEPVFPAICVSGLSSYLDGFSTLALS